MAQDEIIKILKVQTAGSETTVKGLREEIKGLQDALLNVESGTKEYDDVLKKLIDDQAKLAGVMNAGKESGAALEGSYNALQQRLTALTKVWKATNDEATRKKLGNEMKEIRGELSKLDESTGDFRRNVGNYAGSIKDAFSSMGGAVSKVTSGPLQAFKSALGAISKHPIIAAVSLLAGLLVNGLAKAFKRNNDAMDGLQRAFTVFQPIIKATEKAFDAFAGVISKVVEGLSSVVSWIGQIIPGYKEMQEAALAAARLQEDIDERERNGIVQNAAARKRASEARAKSEDKIKYTAKERMAFLNQAITEEESILEREKVIAAEKLLIAQQEYDANTGNTEALKALNEAAANYIDAQAAFTDAQRENNKKRSRLYKEAQSDAKAALLARLNLEKDILDQEMELSEKGSDEQIRLAKEKRKKELDIQLAELKDKIKNRKEYEKAEKLAREKFNRDLQKIDQEGFQASLEGIDANTRLQALRTRDNSAEQLGIQLQGEQEKLTKLKERYDEILTATTATTQMRQAAEIQYQEQLKKTNDLEDKYLNTLDQERSVWKEVALYNYEPELVKIRKQMKLLDYDLFALRKRNNESEDEFLIRRRKLTDEYAALVAREVEINRYNQKAYGEYIKAAKAMEYSLLNQSRRDALWGDPHKRNGMTELIKDLNAAEMSVRNFAQDYGEVFWRRFADEEGYGEKDIRERVKNYVKMTQGILSEEAREVKTDEIINELFGEGDGSLVGKFVSKLNEAQGKAEVVDFLKGFVEVGIVPQEVFDNYIEMLRNYFDKEENLLRQRYENWNNLATHISDISGSIGDIYEENLNQRKEQLEAEGKYDEKAREQLEKEYKNVKAFKIAQATINTIQGAIAAYMGYQELGQPWGMVLGGAAAAAVLASGYAQVQKIKNTDPYKETSTSDSAVFPTTTPYVPQYTQNVTGLQETEQLANAIAKQNIWVSVKDIDSAQQGNKVKVAESRW